MLINDSLHYYLASLVIQHDALNAEIHRLDRIINAVPGNVCWKDTQGYAYGVNKASFEVLCDMGVYTGDDRSVIVGDHITAMFPEQTAEMVMRHDQLVLDRQEAHGWVENFVLPIGTEYRVLTARAPMFDASGDPSGILGMSFNLSKWR